MIAFLRQHPKALGYSLLLHVLILGLAAFSFDSRDAQQLVRKPGPQTQTIQTEIIDEKALEKSARKQAEVEQRKAEAEKKRKAEVARKKAEAEKKRKAEEARKKAEAEKKRKAEEARKKAEAEKKRKAEEAARRKAEEEQRRKEAELQARLAAEERQRELDLMRNAYYAKIRDKISRNWRQPPNAGDKPECEVHVVQGPGGIILDVSFGRCPGTREYRLSVEQAVRKSDPLPKPDDPELFERDILIKFKPRD